MNLFDPSSPLNYYQGFGVGSGFSGLHSQRWVWLVVCLSVVLFIGAIIGHRHVTAASKAALLGYSAIPCLLGAFGSVVQFHHFHYLARSGWPGPLGLEVFIYMSWSTHVGLFSSGFIFIVLFLLRTVLRCATARHNASVKSA